jgi:hypothetical protein
MTEKNAKYPILGSDRFDEGWNIISGKIISMEKGVSIRHFGAESVVHEKVR